MLYQAYQAHCDIVAPLRALAGRAAMAVGVPLTGLTDTALLRNLTAVYELIARAGLTHARPPFGIETVTVGNQEVAVREVPAHVTPFGTLLHFKKDIEQPQPRVLLVAPLSGHFATLLRATVCTMLPEHDVYITDWHNARDAPLSAGRFGFDDYVEHLIRFLEIIGPGTHIVAVCQPCVATLVAAAVMAQTGNPAQPRSMTLMGGPIDTRRNPTVVNQLATSRPLSWFERNVIATVPARYSGAFRRVYPGFLQLAGFMTMNLDRHVMAHIDLFKHLVRGDGESAEATRKFYDEYMSVMDLPADFYLQTVARVFQEHGLPLGTFTSRDRPVEPKAITKTALLCVEGENDDICAVGQTAAALDLCTGLPKAKKARHLQPKVGHYGVFNGKRWRTEIYPKVRAFIQANG
jgi:polyhydroxyalkanoate depolymerase